MQSKKKLWQKIHKNDDEMDNVEFDLNSGMEMVPREYYAITVAI